MSYGDYVPQFTYLLLLKMADGRRKPPSNLTSESPRPHLKGYDYVDLEDALEPFRLFAGDFEPSESVLVE